MTTSAMEKRRLNILIINCDWRNIFRDSFQELYDKLNRDQLGPDHNRFFFFSWSHEDYQTTRDSRFSSIHVKTHWRSFRPFIDLLSFFFIPRAVRKANFLPDIILVYDLGFLPAARRVKKMYGGKIVLCLTNMPVAYSTTRHWGSIKARYSFLIERFFLKFADVFYTINQTMKEYLINLGADPHRIFVFSSNTINRDSVYLKRAVRGYVRKKYGISQNKKIILSVGRLEAEKGYPRLLDIFSRLDQDFFLIILGRGSLLPSLQEQVRILGIEKRVIFMGFIHRDEIWNFYKDADVFMLLSTVEALGLVFWEAMHARVPVIGSTAPGIVETIGRDGDRGRICEPSEPPEVTSKKIEFCIHPNPEKDSMLDRAYEYVLLQQKNTLTINTLFEHTTI